MLYSIGKVVLYQRKLAMDRPCGEDPRRLHPNARRDGTDQPDALSRGGNA